MAWTTPKTDWYGERDSSGNYSGDRFNLSDLNRIIDNLNYLRNLAIEVGYEAFTLISMGTWSVSSILTASLFNSIESNLNTINEHTFNLDYGDTVTFYDNGKFIDYIELNRIESATLDIYSRLMNQKTQNRVFVWNFGTNNGRL